MPYLNPVSVVYQPARSPIRVQLAQRGEVLVAQHDGMTWQPVVDRARARWLAGEHLHHLRRDQGCVAERDDHLLGAG